MASKGNNPIKSTLVFTLLGFLGPAISFFLLPIYLKYLTPEDYGILSLMSLVSAFVAIVINLQLGSAMRTYYFDYSDRPLLLKKYLQNIYSLSLLLTVGFVLLLLWVGPGLFQLVFNSERISFYPYGLLAIAKTAFGVCPGIYYIYLKNGIRLKDFAVYSVSALVLTVCFQYYFIVVEQLNVLGALLGLCFASGILFFAILISNVELLRFRFDKKMIRDSLKFSLPVIPFLFLNWFNLRGDRFLIEQFLTLEKVGQYALLVTLVGLLYMMMGALDNAIRPFLFEAFKEKERQVKEINSYLLFYVVVCLLVASGIILIGHHLHLLTDNSDYLIIIPYFVLGTFAVFVRVYVRLFNEQLYFIKRSKDVTYLAIVSFVILIIAYLILLPIWEIWGVLLAILVANLSNAYFFFYQAQRKFKINHNYKNLHLLPLLVFVGIAGLQLMSQWAGWSNMLFGWIQFSYTVLLLYVMTFKQLQQLYTNKVGKQEGSTL